MENTVKKENRFDTKRLTVIAMLIALGYVCLFMFRFKVQFLTLEFKDVFITMSAFVYGPFTGVMVALTEALLELFTLSDTGIYGFIMNFAGSASLAFFAGLIYKKKKDIFGAVLGLILGVITMTVVMIFMNILITPYYMKCDASVVYGLVPSLLLPFNLIKGSLNAALTLLLYKPITSAMRSVHILAASHHDFKFDKKTVMVSVMALILAFLSIAVLFVYLKANLSWGR